MRGELRKLSAFVQEHHLAVNPLIRPAATFSPEIGGEGTDVVSSYLALRGLKDFSVFHHEGDGAHLADVVEGVAVDGDDVGDFAGFDGAQTV